jgi:hypothetical protein
MDDFKEFPSKSDWDKIGQASAFGDIHLLLDKIDKKVRPKNDGHEIFEYIELQGWLYHFRQRLDDLKTGYIFSKYYYEQGIPDEEWVVNRDGGWQYFPHFNDHHFLIKQWFDFYSDVTYYKMFTIWDTFGHVVNSKYHLGIKQRDVTFSKALESLKQKDFALHTKLRDIKDSLEFKKSRTIRDNITHNYLPSRPGLIGNRQTNDKNVPGLVISFEINRYITSSDIIRNIDELLKLLKQALENLLNS